MINRLRIYVVSTKKNGVICSTACLATTDLSTERYVSVSSETDINRSAIVAMGKAIQLVRDTSITTWIKVYSNTKIDTVKAPDLREKLAAACNLFHVKMSGQEPLDDSMTALRVHATNKELVKGLVTLRKQEIAEHAADELHDAIEEQTAEVYAHTDAVPDDIMNCLDELPA